MKISVNTLNKSYVPRTKTLARFDLGIGLAFLYLACAVPEIFAAEASQSNSQIETLFVTDYISDADRRGSPPPHTRISVYRVNIAGVDEQPQAEVVEVLFDAYEYWRSALSVDPTVANYQNADDFYNLSLDVWGLEDYPEHNIAVFGLLKERPGEKGYFGNSMCFIFADGRSEPFCMVDLNPERLYRPGFVTREEELYISIFSSATPCDLLVFPANNPSHIRATDDYVNFYASPMLSTEGAAIFFTQTFPFFTNLAPSEEEKAQYEKSKRVQLPLVPSKPFPPYRKPWVLEANEEDRLVLREIPPTERNPSIGPLAKEGYRALVTIMKEKNEAGVNPVIWEEEPYTATKEPADKYKIASTPEYSLWRTESGTIRKYEKGKRSTIELDIEAGEHVFLVNNKAFIKTWSANYSAELRVCDTETLFSSTKSEREALSKTLKIDNEKLREDINGLLLIMPVASNN